MLKVLALLTVVNLAGLLTAVVLALRVARAPRGDAAITAPVAERVELAAALRQAVADGQLRVAYQPIVRLATGQPLGAEALLRWTHPDRGEIPPAVFLPLAAEAGLLATIDTRVRQEGLRQLGQWRATGVVDDDFHLSINVSADQLAEAALPATVAADLARFAVPARCLMLELTGAVLADASSVTARVLPELRELGVRLLIDDFGTDGTALGWLRRFPIWGVKIDRSFVAGLGDDDGAGRGAGEIVRAVVALSSALSLHVIAEGVETRSQRDVLAAAGVTTGQGWLWGPAVPAAEFTRHWHAAGPAALAGGRSRAMGQTD